MGWRIRQQKSYGAVKPITPKGAFTAPFVATAF